MEKADIKNRMSEIRENANDDRKKNSYEPQEVPNQKTGNSAGTLKKKICPFSLSSGTARPCGDWCQLYRSGKKYSCPLQELPSISWNTQRK